MLNVERQNQILDILKERQCVTVEYLSRKLYTSGATVRRDLSRMEELGLLIRVRGGAVMISGVDKDTPLILRASENLDKKEKIAKLAFPYTQNNATMFLDSSSTITELAKLFSELRGVSVVTNGVITANVLNEYAGIKVYATGGMIQNNASMVGPAALGTIESMYTDVLFFSCCGIAPESGSTEATENTAAVKKAMMKNARKRILLCDSTKINTSFFCKVCDMKDIDLMITDEKPEEEFLRRADCEVIYPQV